MPLTKRVLFHASNFSSVESLQDHVERNLEADLQAHALARASGTLQQLALLSGYAFEIFHGLSLLTQDVSERTKSLQRRTESVTRRLSEVETAVRVLPTQPELSVKSYSAKYLKNTRNIALPPMLTKQTLSAALRQSLSLACRAPPPLWKIENLLQIDCFRYYTFPGLFFQAWLKSEIVRQELLKEERKQQKVLKKQAKQERKRLKEIALKRFQAQAHSEKEINEEGSTGSNRRSLRAKVINKRATITELVVEEKRERERQPEPVVERTSLEQEEKVSVQSEVVPAPSSNKKSIKNVLGLFKKSKSKKAKDIDVEAEKKSVADSEAASLTAQRRLSLVENQALAQHSSQPLQQIIARESAVNKQTGKVKKKGKEREKERAEEKEREKETEETEGVLRTHTLTNPLRNTETHSLAEIEEREREHREAASLSQAMSTVTITPTTATAIVTPTAASVMVEAAEEEREDREEREEKEERQDAHLLQIDVKHKSKRVASMRQRAKFQSKSTQERERERELGRDRASVRGSYSSTNTEKRALLLDKTERPLSVAVNNFSSSFAAAVGSAAGYDYTDYAPLDDTQAVRETETMSVASSITHTEAHTEKERDVRRNSLSLCTTDLQDFLAQQRERESEQDSTEQLLREIVSNVFDTDALTAAALSPSPSLPVSLAATKSSSLVMQMHTIHEEEESERDSEEEGEKQREQEWAERGEEEERETVFSQSETNDVSFVHKAQKERERDESAIDLLEELEREPEDEGGRWRERTEGESLLDELDVSLPLSLPLSPEEELLQALDGEDNEELPPPAEDEEEEIRESDALSSPPLSDLNERPSLSGSPLSPSVSSSPPPPPPPKRRDSIQRENPLRSSTASVSAPVAMPVPPPPRPPPPRPMPPQPRPHSQVAQPVQPAQPAQPPKPPQPPLPPQPPQPARPSQPLPPSQPPRPSQPPLPPQPPQPAQPQQSTQPLPPRPAPAISLNVLEGIRSGQAALKPAEKPVERVVDLRSGLLSAIKAGGAQLKAVTVAPKPAAKSGMNNFMQSEAVAAILANRAKIAGSDSESSDSDSDSGWSDF